MSRLAHAERRVRRSALSAPRAPARLGPGLPDGRDRGGAMPELEPANEPAVAAERTAGPSGSRRKAVRRILWGVAFLFAVLLYGTFGYVAAGWSLGDAVYMVMITISTVGFTEVHEINTSWLRFHTVLVILLGYFGAGFTLTGILSFITEEELQTLLGHQRVRRQIEALRGHTIVAGMGRMGSLVCSEL